MNKVNIQHTKFVFSILIFLTVINSWAKTTNPESALHLQTDKRIYVSGESVSLKCTVIPAVPNSEAVLFIDICGEGYRITSNLLKKHNNSYEGRLFIPDSVQTGIYLLRAYMGNSNGEAVVISQPLTVLNRFENNSINETKKQKANYLPLNQLTYAKNTSALLNVETEENNCKAGEKINFIVKNNLPNSVNGISFSVYKITDAAEPEKPITYNYLAFTPNNEIKIYENYTIRGIVLDQQNQQAVANQMVFLSTPDSIAQLKYNITMHDGTFMFKINELNQNNRIIIQTKDKSRKYTIQLYPSQLMPPATIPFYIPEENETSGFSKLAIQRALLHSAYNKSHTQELRKATHNYPFYGYCNNRVYPNEYVSLSNFNDIAWEILPLVKYRNNNNSIFLNIWNERINKLMTNPMILVDGVPISSHASISEFNSKTIKWVDVQPDIRCYGAVMFEGLINIQTYSGNFTDVAMPFNALITKPEEFYDDCKTNDSQPFFRDVLCWIPYLNPLQSTHSIPVTCSDEKGQYIAIAQTYTNQGQLIQTAITFNVK